MKVALVHDWLTTLGGSERVVLALHRIWPEAPVFTSVYDPAQLPAAFQGVDVRPSFLQKLPGAAKRHQALLPLMPLAFGLHDLRGFDLVVTSHHACAKGVIVDADALHLAYVHTPMRYAWDLTQEYQATLPAGSGPWRSRCSPTCGPGTWRRACGSTTTWRTRRSSRSASARPGDATRR